jgi:hypothetical protein
VGKTTLFMKIAARFGDKAVHAAGDDPDAALPGFRERCQADEIHPQSKSDPVVIVGRNCFQERKGTNV